MSNYAEDMYASTVGGVNATDDVMMDDVPTDAEGAQEAALGATASNRDLVNRAWVLIIVVGLGGLWLLGLLFKGHIQG